MTGEFNIPDEVVEATARALEMDSRLSYENTAKAVLQAALSAWKATEQRNHPSTLLQSGDGYARRIPAETRLVTPWIPVEEGKEQ